MEGWQHVLQSLVGTALTVIAFVMGQIGTFCQATHVVLKLSGLTKPMVNIDSNQEGKVHNLPIIAIMHDGMIRCSFLLGVFT